MKSRPYLWLIFLKWCTRRVYILRSFTYHRFKIVRLGRAQLDREREEIACTYIMKRKRGVREDVTPGKHPIQRYNALNEFLIALFSTPKQRDSAVLSWLNEPPAKEQTVRQLIEHNIKTILYAPLKVVMNQDRISLFHDRQFSIYYQDLDENELCLVYEIFTQRSDIFRMDVHKCASMYILREYKGYDLEVCFPRKEVLKSYIKTLIKQIGKKMQSVLYVIVQDLLLEVGLNRKDRNRTFLLALMVLMRSSDVLSEIDFIPGEPHKFFNFV